ncbi:MAG: hypothetical protein KDH09_02065 [Chrysiogenetes bacterium]|nr:hypothetical protein [Chrysiogenetes bacterium]
MTKVLTTWQTIAEFFGKSTTTVKRWSRSYPDFPVRKAFDARRGQVWTTRSDLIAWASRHGVPYVGSDAATQQELPHSSNTQIT